jgi:hypothetical protein
LPRLKKLTGSIVVLLTAILLLASLASGRSYIEDFTSPEYCDTLETTAFWDTLSGELNLHPFQFSVAGSCDPPNWVSNVAVEGNYLYVVDSVDEYNGVLQVVDISNPTNRVLVGERGLRTYTNYVRCEGDYVYATQGHGGHVLRRKIVHRK